MSAEKNEVASAYDDVSPPEVAASKSVGLGSSTNRPSCAESAEPAIASETLPPWTERYPEDQRSFLAVRGVDPASEAHGHELNLRLIEICAVFDKAAAGMRRLFGNRADRLMAKIFFPAVGQQTFFTLRQDVLDRVSEEAFKAFAGIERPVPVPRPPDEIEVREDWLTMYPAGYAGILTIAGVPTVAETAVDSYNKRLTELLAPDCEDNEMIGDAAAFALIDTLGEVLDEPDGDDVFEAHFPRDLEYEYLVDYPERFRSMLQRLGRPDYEHPNARAFNNALTNEADRLKEDGLADSSELREFHRLLWKETFGGEPYPL